MGLGEPAVQQVISRSAAKATGRGGVGSCTGPDATVAVGVSLAGAVATRVEVAVASEVAVVAGAAVVVAPAVLDATAAVGVPAVVVGFSEVPTIVSVAVTMDVPV